MVINFLYSSWNYVGAFSTICGIASIIYSVFKWRAKSGGVFSSIICLLGGVCIAVSITSFCIYSSFTTVPYLIGLQLNAANTSLINSGLDVSLIPSVTLESNGSDLVTWSSIDSGTLVLKGSSVTLFTQIGVGDSSEDPEDSEEDLSSDTNEANSQTDFNTISVPDVYGMEQIDATNLLVEYGLEFQVWWYAEDIYTSDVYYIIDQSIPAGCEVEPGTLVKLQLSSLKPE
ncbi:MAG: PASTA domain-containing protein [Oscillospiraceae bacterium]|nr:PASTA domain-containing protein [Oscillospiraceae bacterium]